MEKKNILERNDLIMNTLKNDDNSTGQNNNIQSMIDNTDEVESFLNNIDETDFLDEDNNIPLENDVIINTLEHDGIVTGLKDNSIRLNFEDGSIKTDSNYNIENIYDKTDEIDDFETEESILDNGMIDTQKDANEIPPNEALNNNVDSKDERREVDDDEKIDEAMSPKLPEPDQDKKEQVFKDPSFAYHHVSHSSQPGNNQDAVHHRFNQVLVEKLKQANKNSD